MEPLGELQFLFLLVQFLLLLLRRGLLLLQGFPAIAVGCPLGRRRNQLTLGIIERGRILSGLRYAQCVRCGKFVLALMCPFVLDL